MGVRVIIAWENLDTVLSNLTDVGEKAPQNLEHQGEALANDAEQEWKNNTPRRTGVLQDADVVETGGMSFTLNNATRYYDWVNDGHQTPAGWRTRHGYRPAKRRSHVAGREMTERAVEFIEENIEDYLSKFLDNV